MPVHTCYRWDSLLVGYAQSGLQMNGTLLTPQFLPITGEGIALESLIATGDDASDNVQIQTLDAYGRTVDTYDWNDWAQSEPCWVDSDWEKVEGVTFSPGQGLFVMGSSNLQGIQSSGKVGTNDVVVTLRMNGTLAGNPFPVEIDLQDIIAGGTEASDNVQIQTLDAYGRTVESYDWNDWAQSEPCWVDADWEKVEGVKIAPGMGLFVMGSNDTQYLRFPAPQL